MKRLSIGALGALCRAGPGAGRQGHAVRHTHLPRERLPAGGRLRAAGGRLGEARRLREGDGDLRHGALLLHGGREVLLGAQEGQLPGDAQQHGGLHGGRELPVVHIEHDLRLGF